MVLTVYRDTDARLVSGICLKDYEEAQILGAHISSYNATCSAFSFDKLFKELCRAGLLICDVDQVFSVGHSLIRRHPDAVQVRRLMQP